MIVVLDLETTWLSANKDKIIEVALIKFDEKTFEIIEEYSTLINPEIHIPELNSSITNIYDQDVSQSPIWSDVREKVSEFIWDYPVLWHNVYFDIGFLQEKWISLDDNIVLDTFLMANFLVIGEKSLSLEYLCKYFKIKLSWAHRALNDTKATLYLYEKLIERLQNIPLNNQKILYYLLNNSSDTGLHYLLDTYFLKDTACIIEEDFMFCMEEIFPKTRRYEKIHTKEISIETEMELFFDSWKLEGRENQKAMSKIIQDTMVEEKLSLIEAPTGIWKTFAYLLPSILHSLNTWEQVFVSTSTKALQDQIYFKDLQFLKKNLPHSFSFSKLKGKRNYVWLASFSNFIGQESKYSIQRASFMCKITTWLSKTANGELDELDYYGQEFSFIREINADDAFTFSTDNTYEDREFAIRARRQAKKTNIVVINNNILFQDIDGDNSILSKVENLVIDEAHNLEDVVTKSLQKSFCLQDLEWVFNSIEKKLQKEKEQKSIYAQKKELILFEVSTILDIFYNYMLTKVSDSSKYKICLVKKDFFTGQAADIGLQAFHARIQMLCIEYIDLLNALDDAVFVKLSREILYIENTLDILSKLCDEKSISTYINIANYNENKWISLEYTYLRPWDYLQKNLWTKLSSCILTSATLSSGWNYDYISNMLSIWDFTFHTLETDFDYEKQALLYIPNNMWSVKNNFPAITHFLKDFMKIVRGKTLVLFTSFHSIKEAFLSLDHNLKKEGITVYAQSIWGWKQKLIDFYKQNAASSVLIGTNTFWEWVDIPWDDLKYLIIHKIPFMVPTDPIFQWRSQLFKDPFSEYAVPKAVIKLKQWFWRLIRTKNDSGVVIFLDDRIYSANWGNALYSAFPENIKRRVWFTQDFLDILSKSKK